jgi:hypothetical protein
MTENDLVRLTNTIIKILDKHHPVEQQKVIELLTARHASMGLDDSEFIMESMFKHVRQLLPEFVRRAREETT